jgi:hypothetical protein
MRYSTLAAVLTSASMALPAHAQVPAEVEACRLSGLVALKERSPAIKDLSFDIDGLAISMVLLHICGERFGSYPASLSN